MNIYSWNVNGLRAIATKGFKEFLFSYHPDVLCIQETKAQEHNLTDHHTTFDGYEVYFNSATMKKGYSGVATYTKKKPLDVIRGIGAYDDEGRVLTLEFEKMYVVNVYVLNAGTELKRLNERKEFDKTLRQFVSKLSKKKPVVICGDLNVAHNEIDLKNPKTNMKHAGFTKEEREGMTSLLSAGFIDSFRHFYPEEIKYSWWSYRFSTRARNIGWRIDYVVVSKDIVKHISKAEIHNEVKGSDHCPVSLRVKVQY